MAADNESVRRLYARRGINVPIKHRKQGLESTKEPKKIKGRKMEKRQKNVPSEGCEGKTSPPRASGSSHHMPRGFGVRWMMASMPMSALDSLCARICSCAMYDASPDECECADATDGVYPWCAPTGCPYP